MKASFAHAGVAQGELETAAAEQQVDRIETLLSLLIRTAVNGQFQLHNGAGFVIRELTGASDFL
ncbi:MAG: hypothetical protein QM755_01130 [Luteolibacter sp.]